MEEMPLIDRILMLFENARFKAGPIEASGLGVLAFILAIVFL